jgi:hypothetical protein
MGLRTEEGKRNSKSSQLARISHELLSRDRETGNPLVVDAACGAGLSGLSRRSFSEDGSAASAKKCSMIHDSLSQSNGFRFGGVHTLPRLKLPAASCRESSKCKKVIPFYCSSLANPAAPLKRDLRFATTSYGECARPVEFPEGNPIQRGEL